MLVDQLVSPLNMTVTPAQMGRYPGGWAVVVLSSCYCLAKSELGPVGSCLVERGRLLSLDPLIRNNPITLYTYQAYIPTVESSQITYYKRPSLRGYV